MCELRHTSAVVQKMQGAQTPYGIGDYLGPGQSALSFIASRSSFLIGELLLGKLSETVVVPGNAPHDRPRVLVSDRQPCEFPLHESANAQGPRWPF